MAVPTITVFDTITFSTVGTFSLNGSDLAGSITITTGASVPTNVIWALITFTNIYSFIGPQGKSLVLSPLNADSQTLTQAVMPNVVSHIMLCAAGLDSVGGGVGSASSRIPGFSLQFSANALQPSTTYVWAYSVNL